MRYVPSDPDFKNKNENTELNFFTSFIQQSSDEKNQSAYSFCRII